MYNHAKDNSFKARSHTKIIDDNGKHIKKGIKLLKTEEAKLKPENEFRMEALSRVHLLEPPGRSGNDHIIDHNNKHDGKDNLKCQYCSDFIVIKKNVEVFRTYFQL